MFKQVLVCETKDLKLTKNIFGYKLVDKNETYKFRVQSFFFANSMGAVAGYAIMYTKNKKRIEITDQKNWPRLETELVKFIEEIDYGTL